jgi:serine/threonine-protein kinase haspin
MLRGGATKKAFTYGKRGRTNAVDHDEPGSASEEDSDVQSVAQPRLIPPSRSQKIGYAQQHAAHKAVYTSPVKKHAARRDVPLKQDVNLAISSPARASRVSRQKAKVHNPDLLQPTPRRVRVDISTRDDQGREVKQERRTTTVADDHVRWSPVKRTNTRPKSEPSKAARDRVERAAPPPSRASTSTSHTSRNSLGARVRGTRGPKVVDVTTIDSSDEEEDVVAISSSSSSDFSPIAPAVKRGARKNLITISSDESTPEPPRHSQKSISGLSVPRKSEVSQATQRVRLTGSIPQRSWGNPLRHSTPKRTPNTSRPRQLTPTIDRYSRSSGNPRLSKPPVPASPSYSELDLSLSQDITGLNISSSSNYSALAAEPITQPRHLLGLLSECQQESPHEFSAFVDAFPTDVVVRQNTASPLTLGGKKFTFRKVGEASYSEVFGIGSVVLKIIPLQDESAKSSNASDCETPPPSKAADVLKEITVTRAMADVCGDSFVRLLKTYVVRGRYPSRLLELWDEYDETYGSESVRPGR